MFSLLYIWLVSCSCTYILPKSLDNFQYLSPLSCHMSIVNATVSRHHLDKPILWSIPSVSKVLSSCRHASFHHFIDNIIKTSLKHDLWFPFWSPKLLEPHCVKKFIVFKMYIWCCFWCYSDAKNLLILIKIDQPNIKISYKLFS